MQTRPRVLTLLYIYVSISMFVFRTSLRLEARVTGFLRFNICNSEAWGTPMCGILTLRTTDLVLALENIFLTVQDRIRILVCELFVNWECGLLFFPVLQPCVWESSWIDQEIWAYVLQAVLPKQCQGNWLHQGKYLDPIGERLVFHLPHPVWILASGYDDVGMILLFEELKIFCDI
ncbi:hypothetical protein GmHk_01G002971 [Glycine max]|nr:hypothetical protein GmHk_01G002971 [Glycine max]